MFHVKHRTDVIVIGAGHAGLEAAHAAARIGAAVTLISMNERDIGTLSCNPAIGGVGKGHLVREIDALGGVMARWADAAGIQFRLLNRSKGPAVQGPRTQIDRDVYREAVRTETLATPGITFVSGEVVDLRTSDGAVAGVLLADGARIDAPRVILTTGTFLDGKIHIGREVTPAGRAGDRPSTRLAARLRDHGLRLGRLKTGTPPRLRSSSIDWDRLAVQNADADPVFLAMDTQAPFRPQIACGLTATNEITHGIIRDSLTESALYGGGLSGKGPRYCPSVEDKIVRFADRSSHSIFLEPEGASSDLVYPNGISTSLPEAVQHALVRSIDGLGSAEIVRPGYAIEYDYADPRGLGRDLSFPAIAGLYFAGQINGTTGYEEAAIQGLVAGANAALAQAGRDPLVFDRSTSYAGVLIDDLTTHGASEPYRMFTSRAEFRLSLRCDNAEARLTQIAARSGLVGPEREEAVARRAAVLDAMRSERGLADDVSPMDRQHAQRSLDAEDLYAPYITRQERDVERLREDRGIELPLDMMFDLSGLTTQQKERLHQARPRTLADAMRIEGMSPAAGLVLLAAARGHD